MPTLSAPSPAPASPAEPVTAAAYHRAHAGKLMIIERNDGRPLSTRDFFHVDAVGTHPTGLIVTGRFENSTCRHVMASAVREANGAEIEWLQAHQN